MSYCPLSYTQKGHTSGRMGIGSHVNMSSPLKSHCPPQGQHQCPSRTQPCFYCILPDNYAVWLKCLPWGRHEQCLPPLTKGFLDKLRYSSIKVHSVELTILFGLLMEQWVRGYKQERGSSQSSHTGGSAPSR